MSPRNVLVVLSLLLSMVIGWVWSRSAPGPTECTRGTPPAESKRELQIGLSLDTLKEARWQRDRDIFVERARQLGARVSVQSANSDDTVQMRDCESLIASGVDVLVIAPHDGLAMKKAVEKAKAANIFVVAYDRMIQGADVDLYTSFDNVEVGRRQAQYLADKLGGQGALIRIYGAPTDNNARLFKAGQDEVLRRYPNLRVVHEDWAEDWKPENAKKITAAAIAKGEEFRAILASNDGTAGGAIQALEEEKRAGILVTGQDAELPACQRIAAGSQTMTIYKPLTQLARAAAELSVALVRREVIVVNGRVQNGFKAVPSLLEEVVTVDQSNLVQTIVGTGFHPYDEVYRGIPESQRPPRPSP